MVYAYRLIDALRRNEISISPMMTMQAATAALVQKAIDERDGMGKLMGS